MIFSEIGKKIQRYFTVGGCVKNEFRHGFFALLKGTPRINADLYLIFIPERL